MIRVPAAVYPVVLDDLATVMAGDWVAGMVTEDWAEKLPMGPSLSAVPVLDREPASTSAWVVV